MRTPDTMAQDQEAARMRSRSMSYAQIGAQLGMTKQAAYKAVQRAIADIPLEAAETVLQMELAKLDDAELRLYAIMGKTHYRVGNNGRVVTYVENEGDTPRPLVDDGPVMQAIQTLIRLADRRAKLLGLNAPTQVHADITHHEGLGEVDRDIWNRALEFDRWLAKQDVIDVDESPALGEAGETGAEAPG